MPTLAGAAPGPQPDPALDLVLGRLDGVRKQSGYWMARCPAHEDARASLSVARGTNQPVVMNCLAGCLTADVLAAIGLTLAAISTDDERPRRAEWTPRGDAIVVYQYADENGTPLFEVCRTADKQFSQRRPNSSARSGYSWKLGNVRRVLYHLPQLIAAVRDGRPVYVVEGEKDVHAIEAAGAAATCNPGGAGKWRPEYGEHFRGADVIVVADKDDPGRRHAADVARSLADVAKSVAVVEAADGKDAADHLAAGHGLGNFRPISYPPGAAVAGSGPGETRRLVLTPASQIPPRPVRWGWEDRIPAAHVGLIPGREGIGKSLFLIWMAAQITRGTLPGAYFGQPHGVFYCASEDSWQHTIVPRLIAAGADMDRVFRIEVETVEASSVMELMLPRDCDLVGAAIREYDIALLGLDPLMSVLDARIDTHHDRDLRTALEPLAKMADNTGCMVVGLAHFSKGASSDPLNLVTGSRAFTAVVRSVVAVARDDDSDDGRCVVSQVKNNLGRLDLPNLTYVIKDVTVETEEGDAHVGRLIFTGETDRTVQDILIAQNEPDNRLEIDDAAAWLEGYLTDHGGGAAVKDTKKAAKAEGIAERTLQRARRKLGVTSTRAGFPATATWSLPVIS